MKTLAEPRPLITPSAAKAVETQADTRSPVSIDATSERRSWQAWQSLIDQKLKAWLTDPSQLENDGVDAPTGTIMRLALDYAEALRDQGFLPPDRITADANGGVVFERQRGDFSEIFHVWDDGSVELQQFNGTTLINRSVL
jgi:hypothetical protein